MLLDNLVVLVLRKSHLRGSSSHLVSINNRLQNTLGQRLSFKSRRVQSHSVLLDRVHLTLESRRNSLNSFLRRTAKHGSHVRAHADETISLISNLVHRRTHVLELGAKQRAQFAVLIT